MSAARRQRRRLQTLADVTPTAWSRSDALFFTNNPKRSHRLRRRYPGEDDLRRQPGLPVDADLVVVRQIAPGFRLRQSFAWTDCDPDFRALLDELVNDGGEDIAHAMFDLATEDGLPTSTAEILAAINAYKAIWQ